MIPKVAIGKTVHGSAAQRIQADSSARLGDAAAALRTGAGHVRVERSGDHVHRAGERGAKGSGVIDVELPKAHRVAGTGSCSNIVRSARGRRGRAVLVGGQQSVEVVARVEQYEGGRVAGYHLDTVESEDRRAVVTRAEEAVGGHVVAIGPHAE